MTPLYFVGHSKADFDEADRFGKRIKQLCLDMCFSVKTMFSNFQYYFFLHLHRDLNSSSQGNNSVGLTLG